MPDESTPLASMPTERPRNEWWGIVARFLVAAIVLVGGYVALAYYLGGRVPTGTTVQGVDIGGLGERQAAERLDTELDDLATGPVTIRLEDEQASLRPAQAGLTLDLDATLDGVASVSFDPRNMWARLTGDGRSLTVSTQVDPQALREGVNRVAQEVDREPVQAKVVLNRGEVETTLPEDGVAVRVEATADRIGSRWPQQRAFTAPKQGVPADLDADQVETFVADVAEPAVAEPVVIQVKGEEARASITPNQLSRLLTVEPATTDAGSPLRLVLDQEGLEDLVGGALADVERPARDATVRLNDQGRPETVSARVGKRIDQAAALAGVGEIVGADAAASDQAAADDAASTASGDVSSATSAGPDDAQQTSTKESDTVSVQDRTVMVQTSTIRPKITNKDAEAWEVDAEMAEFVSEFPTGAENAARTENIRVGLRYVNGSVVMPGEQFSLSSTLAPISADRGYVEAGVIQDGRLVEGIGGGLSQVSTALLNTAWFSGVELDAFTPHSYYISRYPVGREATISVGQIDNVWTNDTSSPVVIQAFVEGNAIVMRFWGDRQYTVQTRTGPRRDITQPDTTTDDSPDCLTQSAVEGFTITVSRDLVKAGDVVRTDTYTTTYDPSPGVTCTG
ncbi:MAG: VanW family protein [Ornithinimicrobium sp.]